MNQANTTVVQEILLTEEQQLAVDSLHVNTIVPAGAGAGKTRVLVERFLRILEENPRRRERVMDSIVAITFTEKAALEMKDRVQQGIQQRVSQARKNGDYPSFVYWQTAQRELHRATISTFHSFCARLLREYPVEAGIDPSFSVLDETESTRLLQDVVNQVLQKQLAQGKPRLQQITVIVNYSNMTKAICSLYRDIAGSGLSMDEVKRATWNDWESVQRNFANRIAQQLQEVIDAGDCLAQEGGSTKAGKEFAKGWQIWRGALQSYREGEEHSLENLLSEFIPFIKKRWGNNQELTRLKNDFAKRLLLPLQQRLAAFAYRWIEKETLTELFALLSEVDHQYGKAKQQSRGIDFDELQVRALKLLQQNQGVRRHVQEGIDFLMVDEFQDTNDLQKRFVHLLVEREDGIPPGSLFVVGDPKQSIYRFRGAEVRVFSEMQREIEEMKGRVAPLVNNFRSDPRLIQFINGFFATIMSNEESSPNYYRGTVAMGKKGRSEAPVEWLCIPGKEEREEECRRVEAQWIARRIGELRQEGYSYGEITLLFRSMTQIKTYEQALAEAGIPIYVVGGRGFYQQQEIRDLVHVLTWLNDRSHRIAWAGMLRSPYVGVSDDALFLLAAEDVINQEVNSWKKVSGLAEIDARKLESMCRWLIPLQRKAGRIPIDELLQELIVKSSIRPVLLTTEEGRQACANLDKLVQFARSLRKKDSCSLQEFLAMIELLTAGEVRETEAAIETTDSDSVKLMTIHQSKGLEFPVVIVPDVSRSPRNDSSLFSFDRLQGITSCIVEENEKKFPLRHLLWKENHFTLEQEESVRILYVAATRAKERLIFSMVPESAKNREEAEILSYRKWSEWFDCIMDSSRIDGEKGIWKTEIMGQDFEIPVVMYGKDKQGIKESAFPTTGLSLLKRVLQTPVSDADYEDVCSGLQPLSVTQDAEIPLSVSAIMAYSHCPRQYYLAYVLQMPQWERGTDDIAEREGEVGRDPLLFNDMEVEEKGLSSIATPALRGILAHKAIEMLRPLSKSNPLPADHEEIEKTILISAQQLDVDEGVLGTCMPDLIRWLKTYVDSDLYRKGAESQWYNEVRFTLSLGGFQVEGILDRLSIHQDGSMTLVDFKTNRLREKRDFYIKVNQYMPQLHLYALAVEQMFGRVPDKVALYFLDWGDNYEKRIDQEWMDAARHEMERLLQRMRNSTGLQGHPIQSGSHCKSCSYGLICKGNPYSL